MSAASEKWIGCVERYRDRAVEWARIARATYGCKVTLRKRRVRADGVSLLLFVAVVSPGEMPTRAPRSEP